MDEAREGPPVPKAWQPDAVQCSMMEKETWCHLKAQDAFFKKNKDRALLCVYHLWLASDSLCRVYWPQIQEIGYLCLPILRLKVYTTMPSLGQFKKNTFKLGIGGDGGGFSTHL